jgi:hypothetical protein
VIFLWPRRVRSTAAAAQKLTGPAVYSRGFSGRKRHETPPPPPRRGPAGRWARLGWRSQKCHAAYGARPRGGRLIHEAPAGRLLYLPPAPAPRIRPHRRLIPSPRGIPAVGWLVAAVVGLVFGGTRRGSHIWRGGARAPGSRFRPRHCVALPPHDEHPPTTAKETQRRLCAVLVRHKTKLRDPGGCAG